MSTFRVVIVECEMFGDTADALQAVLGRLSAGEFPATHVCVQEGYNEAPGHPDGDNAAANQEAAKETGRSSGFTIKPAKGSAPAKPVASPTEVRPTMSGRIREELRVSSRLDVARLAVEFHGSATVEHMSKVRTLLASMKQSGQVEQLDHEHFRLTAKGEAL